MWLIQLEYQNQLKTVQIKKKHKLILHMKVDVKILNKSVLIVFLKDNES